MSTLVIGSVAYDSVATPSGFRQEALGGSATYFSISSSYFTQVSLVAVVGEDFSQTHLELLKKHGVELSGLHFERGKTFRWSGVYETENMNKRSTLDTQLNVFAHFAPTLMAEHKRTPFVFLANIDPELQMDVLNQMDNRPKLIALDTMNFWIEGENASLRSAIRDVDVFFVDENEARELAKETNLVYAGRKLLDMGPNTVVIKRGENGLLMIQGDFMFMAPAFPLENVVDPTGAGDSFAGGFLGYLDATNDLSFDGFRRAAAVGSVMGSFACESFSLDRLASLDQKDIAFRFRSFVDMCRIEPFNVGESLPWRNDFVRDTRH